jgi:hypothetical protein
LISAVVLLLVKTIKFKFAFSYRELYLRVPQYIVYLFKTSDHGRCTCDTLQKLYGILSKTTKETAGAAMRLKVKAAQLPWAKSLEIHG